MRWKKTIVETTFFFNEGKDMYIKYQDAYVLL